MTKIEHRYIVCKQLLEDIEKFIKEKKPTMDELKAEIHRSRLRYQCGLAHLDN